MWSFTSVKVIIFNVQCNITENKAGYDNSTFLLSSPIVGPTDKVTLVQSLKVPDGKLSKWNFFWIVGVEVGNVHIGCCCDIQH